MPLHGSRTSTTDRNEWRTPPYLIEAIRAHFTLPPFQLDLACRSSNVIPGAMMLADDTLAIDWTAIPEDLGPCWWNHPYDDPFPWMQKGATIAAGLTPHVSLSNADISTEWFEIVWQYATQITFLQPRVRFLRPDGTVSGSPPMGQMACLWGGPGNRFNGEFQNMIGDCPIVSTLRYLPARTRRKPLPLDPLFDQIVT